MILELGSNYAKTIKHYVQDLNIDTVNATRHLDTTIHIALSHKKISQNKNSNTTNMLRKRQSHIIKHIHRNLINISNSNESR
jgi:hypothetical protein